MFGDFWKQGRSWWIGAAVVLSGCITIPVDESLVFQPGKFGDPDAPRESTIRYEAIFLEPKNIVIDVWADGQKAKHHIRSRDFVKSSVTHDLIKSQEQHLAITRVEREGEQRPLVVHCGGNVSERYESASLYALKIIPTADVLIFDYPGYGESSGIATAESLSLANQIIADYVHMNYDPTRSVFLWGHSLGGFVCADMSQYFETLDGVILETTATNAEDVTDVVVPWFVKPFIKTPVAESFKNYDVVNSLSGVAAPILVLGAKKDKTLPVRLSHSLSGRLKAGGHDVTYVEFPEANHISVPTQADYASTIESFLLRGANR